MKRKAEEFEVKIANTLDKKGAEKKEVSIKITELSPRVFFEYLVAVSPRLGLKLKLDEYQTPNNPIQYYLRIFDGDNDNNFQSIGLRENETVNWNGENLHNKHKWIHLKTAFEKLNIKLEITNQQVPISPEFPELTQTVTEIKFIGEGVEQKSEVEEKKYIVVTYIHCEGAARKSTVWEIPAIQPEGFPLKDLYNHFENERSADQRSWDEHRPKEKDEPNNPYAFLVADGGWDDFDLLALQFFKKVEAPFCLNGRFIFVQVADGE